MRRLLGIMIVGVVTAAAPAVARAQAPLAAPYRMNNVFAAPGFYGMSYGAASFGVPRTYSEFSSPYGGGYGYGYAPYGLAPSRYGVGLWRPGFVAPGYAYGASYYRTFPVPYTVASGFSGPPVGVYAPAFGPSSFYGW